MPEAVGVVLGVSALVLLKEADPPLAVAVCVTEKEVVALLVGGVLLLA